MNIESGKIDGDYEVAEKTGADDVSRSADRFTNCAYSKDRNERCRYSCN